MCWLTLHSFICDVLIVINVLAIEVSAGGSKGWMDSIEAWLFMLSPRTRMSPFAGGREFPNSSASTRGYTKGKRWTKWERGHLFGPRWRIVGVYQEI
jgi:hypothetical protein